MDGDFCGNRLLDRISLLHIKETNMKRIEFVKVLALAGLGTPLLAACGETPQPTAQPVAASPIPAATLTVAASTAASSSTVAAAASYTAASTQPVTVAAVKAAPVQNNTPIVLHFSEFYSDPNSAVGLEPSEKIKGANGLRVQLTGYMAPPLKPALDFFVLTRIKLVVCPFCSSSTDWPQDIVLVTLDKGKTIEQMEDPLTIVGRLEVGDAVDPQTGFFSLLRLRAESIDVFKGS